MAAIASRLRRMGRSAFTTSAWTTAGFVLLSGVAGVIAARYLGPTERGLLAIAVVWSSLAGSMSAYGMPETSAYFTARDRARPARDTATALAVALGAGSLVAVGGVAITLAFVSGAVVPAMTIAFATMLPNIVAGAALGGILGLGRYRAWGLGRMLLPLLALVGVVAVVLIGWRTALAVTVATAAATVIQLVVLLGVLRRYGRITRPSRARVRPVLAYMWRSVVSGTGLLVSSRLDQLLLSVLVAPQVLGVYAVAASFGAVIQPLAGSAGAVVLRRIASGGAREARPALARGLRVALVIAGGLGALTFLAATQLVGWLFGDAFAGAVASVRILTVGAVAMAVSSVLASALRGLGEPLAPARATYLGAVTTAILLPLLVGPWGVEGAAAAASASAIVVLLGMTARLRVALRRHAAPAAE